MKMVIMRGLPGSGKSTLAKKIAERYGAVICSADDYWIEKDGIYRFDPKRLHLAHQSCYRKAEMTLTQNRSCVIDNTNIQRKWYSQYIYLGELHHADIEIYEVKAPVDVCFQRGTHNVPLHTIEAMARKWQEEPEKDLIKVWQ